MIRTLLLWLALSFSFGGFTFYAAVVVPIGTEVLDSTSQGFVTRQVTKVLNIASAITLAILIWELLATFRTVTRKWLWCYLSLLLVYSGCLLGLFLLHPRLDELLDPETFSVLQSEEFYRRHRQYLWLSTLQWLATIGMMWQITSRSAKSIHENVELT